MYCVTCGTGNDPDAKSCRACGAGLSFDYAERPHISNHLALAILVTIFCCLPLGIASIVYAAQVNGLVASGKIDEARQASKNAKIWVWASFAIGLIINGTIGVVVLRSVISSLGEGLG